MATVGSWAEGILLTLLFVTLFTLVIVNFNSMYDENYVVPIIDDSTKNLFVNYQSTAQTQVEGGEVSYDSSEGITTLKSSYGLAKDVITIVWSFISGGFIENTINLLNLGAAGTALATTLRILYFISIVFALLYALFKVVL